MACLWQGCLACQALGHVQEPRWRVVPQRACPKRCVRSASLCDVSVSFHVCCLGTNGVVASTLVSRPTLCWHTLCARHFSAFYKAARWLSFSSHRSHDLCDFNSAWFHVQLKPRNQAAEELDNFSHILEMEGVTVRRPEVRPGDFDRPVSTPDFESKTQLYAAMPRDVLIVVSLGIRFCHHYTVRTVKIFSSWSIDMHSQKGMLHHPPPPSLGSLANVTYLCFARVRTF